MKINNAVFGFDAINAAYFVDLAVVPETAEETADLGELEDGLFVENADSDEETEFIFYHKFAQNVIVETILEEFEYFLANEEKPYTDDNYEFFRFIKALAVYAVSYR